MNRIIKTTIIALFASMMITSCDLDKSPYDKIPITGAWQTIDDAQRFRLGLYSYLRTVNGGLFIKSSDFQSDLFNPTISFGNRGGDLYSWTFSSSQYDITDIWQYNYSVITNANNILNNIDEITPEDDDERSMLNNIKGEAYMARAMAYHKLAIRFAKDYEPASAASDLGLPIVFEIDARQKPDRATLLETYKRIKDDIAEARTLITTEGRANAIMLTVDAIDAFEARVDLYMHNYTNAITLADKIIAKYELITDKTEFADMWKKDVSKETIFQPFRSKDEKSSSLGLYISFNKGAEAYTPDFVPAKWVLDLYEPDDIRRETFFFNAKIRSNDQTADDVYMLYKYPGNTDLQTTEYEYYNMQKVFRSAEAYLIAAEASYREQTGNAVTYLNSLREKRGASQLNAELSGDELFAAIQNEWIREFIGEGSRLDDLKRWHVGFKRGQSQNDIILHKNFMDLEVTPEAQKFVWEIPANDLNSNKNLIPNW